MSQDKKKHKGTSIPKGLFPVNPKGLLHATRENPPALGQGMHSPLADSISHVSVSSVVIGEKGEETDDQTKRRTEQQVEE